MMNIRSLPDALVYALVAANNEELLSDISTNFHLTRKERTNSADYKNPTVSIDTIATAAATTFEEAIALVNEIRPYADAHFTDTIAHDTATSAAITIADATDTATGAALMNEIKEQALLHYTGSNIHFTADETNTITAADATADITEYCALVNELKTLFVNTHMQGAPAGHYINIVPA